MEFEINLFENPKLIRIQKYSEIWFDLEMTFCLHKLPHTHKQKTQPMNFPSRTLIAQRLKKEHQK